MKNTTKIIRIPPESSERFVNFSEFGGGEYGAGGIFMAALCSYPGGYHVCYPAAERHIVLFCRSGRLRYRYGENTGIMCSGEVLVMPAGGCQEFSSDERLESVFFLLTPGAFWGEPEFRRGETADAELIYQLMSKALRISAADPGRTGALRETLGRMILEVLGDELHGSDRERTPFENLRARMRLHPERHWSVAEMAARCGVSVPHFFVQCRKHYGMSPYRMLKRLRMEQARELLVSTGYPIKTVAGLCGYDHLFSFSRCFRSVFQEPPAEYRRKHRRGDGAPASAPEP